MALNILLVNCRTAKACYEQDLTVGTCTWWVWHGVTSGRCDKELKIPQANHKTAVVCYESERTVSIYMALMVG